MMRTMQDGARMVLQMKSLVPLFIAIKVVQ